MKRVVRSICLAVVLLLASNGESNSDQTASFELTDAKICLDVDEARRPLRVTSEVPAGTEQVYCWFAWSAASRGLQLTTRWHYVTEDLQIFELPVALTRISDNGVVSLSMPAGKAFPSGSYRVDLEVGNTVVRSLAFTVLPVRETAQSPAQTAGEF